MGWGGGGVLTGTPIDISSLYLRHEFFLSSELRHHSETTLHHGVSPLADANVCQNHLNDNKCKKKIRPDFFEPADSLQQWSYFLSSYHVSRGICFKATLCHVHHFTRNMHANIREQKISCSFYSARMKNCHRHVNGFGDLPFISLAYRARSLKKYFPDKQQLGGKKKTFTKNKKLSA